MLGDTNCLLCEERVSWLVLVLTSTEPPVSGQALTIGLHREPGEPVPRWLGCWSLVYDTFDVGGLRFAVLETGTVYILT